MADYSVEGDVVRYGGSLLEGADASSFERLPPSYGRDASHAFWGVNPIDLPLDLSAFRVLGPDHATDGRLILWGNIAIEEADRDSFRVLSGRVAVDGKRVYFDGAPIAGADAATEVPLHAPSPHSRSVTSTTSEATVPRTTAHRF